MHGTVQWRCATRSRNPQQPVREENRMGWQGLAMSGSTCGKKTDPRQVVPEHAPPQPHLQAGKPGHHPVSRFLQPLRVYRGILHHRESVHRRVIVPLNGRIHIPALSSRTSPVQVLPSASGPFMYRYLYCSIPARQEQSRRRVCGILVSYSLPAARRPAVREKILWKTTQLQQHRRQYPGRAAYPHAPLQRIQPADQAMTAP